MRDPNLEAVVVVVRGSGSQELEEALKEAVEGVLRRSEGSGEGSEGRSSSGVGRFLEERCEVTESPEDYLRSADLYEAYVNWCRAGGEEIEYLNAGFMRALKARFLRQGLGVEWRRTASERGVIGLVLRDDSL